jgi:transposase-like protein
MKAAMEIYRTLLEGYQGVLRVRTNDTLKSSHAAKREILARVEHHQHRHRNNNGEFAPDHTAAGGEQAAV